MSVLLPVVGTADPPDVSRSSVDLLGKRYQWLSSYNLSMCLCIGTDCTETPDLQGDGFGMRSCRQDHTYIRRDITTISVVLERRRSTYHIARCYIHIYPLCDSAADTPGSLWAFLAEVRHLASSLLLVTCIFSSALLRAAEFLWRLAVHTLDTVLASAQHSTASTRSSKAASRPTRSARVPSVCAPVPLPTLHPRPLLLAVRLIPELCALVAFSPQVLYVCIYVRM